MWCPMDANGNLHWGWPYDGEICLQIGFGNITYGFPIHKWFIHEYTIESICLHLLVNKIKREQPELWIMWKLRAQA